MFGLDAATTTLLQGLFVALITGGGTFYLGVWDRKRTDKNDAMSGINARTQQLDENWSNYIKSIEADRERKRMLLLASDLQIDQLEKEKNWLWGALHKFENVAHDMRHLAINQIWQLTLHYRDKGPPPVGMPDVPHLPSAYSLYEEQKGKQNV